MRYPPHFNNPWISSSGQQQPYSNSVAPNVTAALDNPVQRPTTMAYPVLGVPVSQSGTGITLPDGTFATDNLPDVSQDLSLRGYGYAASASPSNQSYAPTSAPYSAVEYPGQDRSPYNYADTSRRSSHPSVPSAFYESLDAQRQRQSSLVDFSRMNAQQPTRSNYNDAIEASRSLASLNNSDITPRNIYGGQNPSRSSTDSYGFPATHSAHSSVSSASYGQNGYYGGEGSVTDYSSASESVDMATSRTLPRPNGFGASMPPAPQSMMGQFSSRVSSSSQKKHKCKICDKRFTRPSSLQTHMYSHTGEKREYP